MENRIQHRTSTYKDMNPRSPEYGMPHTRLRHSTSSLLLHICCPCIFLSIYSETSIYRSQIYRFPGSFVQFLWSLNKSYLNYGNKTRIDRSSMVRILGPHEC
jgi:hypothetical protein